MHLDVLVKYFILNTYNLFISPYLEISHEMKKTKVEKCYIHYTSTESAAGYFALAHAYEWC